MLVVVYLLLLLLLASLFATLLTWCTQYLLVHHLEYCLVRTTTAGTRRPTLLLARVHLVRVLTTAGTRRPTLLLARVHLVRVLTTAGTRLPSRTAS